MDIKIETITSLLADIRALKQYTAHDPDCEIEHTDFCTCGLGLVMKTANKDVKMVFGVLEK